jgi:hypothetical protein
LYILGDVAPSWRQDGDQVRQDGRTWPKHGVAVDATYENEEHSIGVAVVLALLRLPPSPPVPHPPPPTPFCAAPGSLLPGRICSPAYFPKRDRTPPRNFPAHQPRPNATPNFDVFMCGAQFFYFLRACRYVTIACQVLKMPIKHTLLQRMVT